MTPATERTALILLLLVGGWLRFSGLDFGLPLELRPDELIYHGRITHMVAAGTLDPGFYQYPGLAFHLPLAWLAGCHVAGGILGVDAAQGTLLEFLGDRPIFLLLMRSLSALLGTLTLVVAWRLGRRLGGTGAGLLAALFLAAAFLHVRDSHFGVVDSWVTLAVLLAVLQLLRARACGRAGAFALAGALIGIAAALKYLPAVLALAVVPAVCGCRRAAALPLRGLLLDRRLWCAGCATLLGFLAGAPYTLLSFSAFREGFGTQLSPYEQLQQGVARQIPSWSGLTELAPHGPLHHYVILGLGLGLGLPLLATGTLALLDALCGRRAAPRLVGIAVLIYLASLLVLARERPFVRYVLPLMPLLVAVTAAWLTRRLPLSNVRQALIWSGLLALLVAPPLLRSLSTVQLFRTPTSWELLRDDLQDSRGRSLPLAVHRTDTWNRLQLTGRVRVPWDPPRLVADGPVRLVVGSHPHRLVRRPREVRQILDAAGSWTEDLHVAAFGNPRRGFAEAVFESSDNFLFPLDGFSLVQRGGPDFRVYTLQPRASTTPGPQGIPPGTPRLVSLGAGAGLACWVAWEPGPGRPAAGYYVAFNEDPVPPERVPHRGVLKRSPVEIACDLGPHVRRGFRYRVTVIAVTPFNASLPSNPVWIERP